MKNALVWRGHFDSPKQDSHTALFVIDHAVLRARGRAVGRARRPFIAIEFPRVAESRKIVVKPTEQNSDLAVAVICKLDKTPW